MKAVLLDRDGVINEDREDYVKSVDELRVYPYAPLAIRRLNDAGLDVFVVSNQQAVAKGLMTDEDLQEIEDEIRRQVEAVGGSISAFYYCKHFASEGCSCRKPRPGLLLAVAKENGVDLSSSFMVGDNERDIAAGKAAGCRTVLVLTGKRDRNDVDHMANKPDCVVEDMAEAADYIVNVLKNSHNA